MVEKLMVRLLDDQYQHLRDMETTFVLLMSMLVLADHTGNRLRGLASSLADIPSLLGKVISSDLSSGFLGDWVDSLGKSHPNASTLGGWTKVAAHLIDRCAEDHNLEEVLDRWKSLNLLKEQLHACERNSQSPDYQIAFSGDQHTLLRDFGLIPPHSKATLKSTIDVVDITHTFGILTALIKSMPCRLCFSNCTGGVTTSILTPHTRRGSGGNGWFDEPEDDKLQYADLLGQSLGKWKIVLSAQALKDLQNSASEGRALMPTYKLMFPRYILMGQY